MPAKEVELGDRRPAVAPAGDQGQQREMGRVPGWKALRAENPMMGGQVHVVWGGPAPTGRLQRQHVGRVADHLAAANGGHDAVLVDRPERAAGAERGHRGELDAGRTPGAAGPTLGPAGRPTAVGRPAPAERNGRPPTVASAERHPPARTGSASGPGAGSADRWATAPPPAPTERRAAGATRPGRPAEASRRWSPSDPSVTPWRPAWSSPRPHPPGSAPCARPGWPRRSSSPGSTRRPLRPTEWLPSPTSSPGSRPRPWPRGSASTNRPPS